MNTDQAYEKLVEAVKANGDAINSVHDLIKLQREVIATMQERADKEERYARKYEADNAKLRELLKEAEDVIRGMEMTRSDGENHPSGRWLEACTTWLDKSAALKESVVATNNLPSEDK